MHVRIKFCGLTRAGDVEAAVALGCDYVGVIFAGGPRNRTLGEAASILRHSGSARRVGVFGAPHATELNHYVTSVPLSVAQLHGDSSPKAVMAARAIGVTEVWSVLPVVDGALRGDAHELFQCADAVVLDTKGANGLGGTGRSFDWAAAAAALASVPRQARLVIAGGLTPDNVAQAIAHLKPDVVDVSSGVESAPGVKDPILMSRFVQAVRSA
ncbi:MAG TPA: phosphoribosylanthranilate isomerase [Gemmatimonadaceae bacterium]|nr:phosphoribosylanthranilate isomerase [Gemmatimonadaceae bacterium]